MIGRIHSIESFGTVDGPRHPHGGILSGCPMRCLYCHNPDTWDPKGGTPMTAEQILAQYRSAAHFYRRGGITVTGGEPLMQIGFVTELFEAPGRKASTPAWIPPASPLTPDSPGLKKKFDRLMASTCLVLLDIKHIDPAEHPEALRSIQKPVLAFASYLEEKKVPVWIRHVVVPGITDNDQYLYQLGLYLGTLTNIKALDVLPYHDLGKPKYEALGMDYPLERHPAPGQRAGGKGQGNHSPGDSGEQKKTAGQFFRTVLD